MAALDDNLRKVPPQNLEAESSVLGGILLENEAINQVLEILRPEDFYRESHRKILRAMIEITDRGEPVEFALNQVVAGWTEGLQLMPVNSKFRFWVPSSIGYGASGNGPIGPNATLVFEIELLGIVP